MLPGLSVLMVRPAHFVVAYFVFVSAAMAGAETIWLNRRGCVCAKELTVLIGFLGFATRSFLLPPCRSGPSQTLVGCTDGAAPWKPDNKILYILLKPCFPMFLALANYMTILWFCPHVFPCVCHLFCACKEEVFQIHDFYVSLRFMIFVFLISRRNFGFEFLADFCVGRRLHFIFGCLVRMGN